MTTNNNNNNSNNSNNINNNNNNKNDTLENKIDIDSMELNVPAFNISNKFYNKNNSTKILEQNNKKEKTTRVGQIIKLLDGIEPYDIIEELQNTQQILLWPN